jgi:hypothetical protein
MTYDHRGPAKSGRAQHFWVPLIEIPDWKDFKAGKRSRVHEFATRAAIAGVGRSGSTGCRPRRYRRLFRPEMIDA